MKGKTARKLPEIKACPCGELRCGLVERTHADTEKLVGYFVISECGWIGPTRKTKSGAILAWNRRAPDADAERRGAREVLKELQVHANEMFDASMADKSKEWAEACAYFEQWAWLRLKTGKFGERGEVLPAKAKGRKRT